MVKSYTEQYETYKERHNGSPKHSFGHFLIVAGKYHHHRTHIRPKIEWWQQLKKDNF